MDGFDKIMSFPSFCSGFEYEEEAEREKKNKVSVQRLNFLQGLIRHIQLRGKWN